MWSLKYKGVHCLWSKNVPKKIGLMMMLEERSGGDQKCCNHSLETKIIHSTFHINPTFVQTKEHI